MSFDDLPTPRNRQTFKIKFMIFAATYILKMLDNTQLRCGKIQQ